MLIGSENKLNVKIIAVYRDKNLNILIKISVSKMGEHFLKNKIWKCSREEVENKNILKVIILQCFVNKSSTILPTCSMHFV